MDRVFLDANVLFSAAYRPDSGLRRLWGLPSTKLITSAYAIEEARRNLDPEKHADLDALLDALDISTPVPADRALKQVRALNEKDRPILLAAISNRATHLLTGDVTHFGPYFDKTIEGVLVLAPAEYLRRF